MTERNDATDARESRAPNTRRAYRADWADFTTWRQEHGHTAVPALPVTVVLYLSERARPSPKPIRPLP